MGLPIFQVDAFTPRPFAGNPAAVCVLSQSQEDCWMQAVAREMNLSETAFLCRQAGGFQLRWFTPTVEVDLCGHATLASAHILWEAGYLAAGAPARFYTRSGLLTAAQQGEWIELDFPAEPAESVPAPADLVRALGVTPRSVGKNRLDYLVEVESEEAVCGLQPDFAVLRTVPTRGVIVTSRASSSDFDFVSRFFAPGVGIEEDPVTGSAHCCLGPFWGQRLHRDALTAYQASARGGVVRVRLRGSRVLLGGQAVTVLRGELV
ncbi:MAG: PhzF family phenazine biosynthesis protein [Candidatus Tectomicrobia bacterium]|uniref:PhzF family phenazine biosynthesis protein n=1 Tax=Tectimicrobiota bacterium TaxID=2528274 RepID=A0A932CQE5_UNCTE|nr:PhzF family phenazine biosynthesis protein [Candidatus Tectomicrobia bacterium]